MSAVGPLVAYLPWQARDSMGRALLAPGIFLLAAAAPLWAFAASNSGIPLTEPGPAQDFARNLYNTFVSMAVVLGAVVLMNQVHALDRERQHFRFLFAHQVAPWQFYLQRFVVAAALFLAGVALIPLGFSALVTDVAFLPTMQTAALYALLVGALMFLCGALTQRDGLALILVYLGTALLQQVDRADGLPGWLAPVVAALPPFAVAGDLRTAWLTGGAFDTGDLLHVVAYSVALLIAALVVIKRFPLVR
ncbi:MAG: hypothetical protein WD771_04325 [Gemmatimonadaceae bacterium]